MSLATPIIVAPPAADAAARSAARASLTEGPRPVPTFLAASVTFGLLPAFLWPTRWARFLDAERPYYLNLIPQWQRAQPKEGPALDAVAARLRPMPLVTLLTWLSGGFVLGCLALLAHQAGWTAVLRVTYGYGNGFNPVNATPFDVFVHRAWVWGLTFAYACQWYAARSHAGAVHDLVKWTNRLGRENDFARVRNEATRLGLGVLWVVAAVALCYAHAWWGIPMVLAGALQRRYIRTSGPRLRAALAGQVRDGVATLPAELPTVRFCPTPHCGGRLPGAARFCPRCGAASVAAEPGEG